MTKTNKTKTTRTNGKTAAAAKRHSKAEKVVALLKRDSGATIDDMVKATGWQKHSVRGFMAGALKKRHGLTALSEKTETGRVYRVVAEPRA
jgi:predicted ArsR family transcriptional regulator